MVKERNTDDVVDDRRLPGWENHSINEWIGIYLGQLSTDYASKALQELLSEHGYTGNSPKILFGIYDFLAPESDEALVHGIRAYELSDHDLEQVAKLKNPGRIVSYIIDVTDDIEPLTALLQKMFYNSEIRSQLSGLGSLRAQYRSSEKSNAAPSIVGLGIEISERLAHISLNGDEVRESLGFKNWNELYSQRMQALEFAVLAQQQLTGDSQETIDILTMYDSLTGTADIRGLDHDVLDVFMRIKLELDKPSQGGKTPEHLKADAYYEDRRAFGGFSQEQEWRMRHFGRQKKDWELNQEYRDQSQEQRDQDQEKLKGDYRKMIEDPWAFYSEQLTLLGLAKEMSLSEAKSAFRRKIREYSSAFNSPFNTSHEYAESQDAAKAILAAWEAVSQLYKAKEPAQEQAPV